MKMRMMTFLIGLIALATIQACGEKPPPNAFKVDDYVGELPPEWYRAPKEISLTGVEGGSPEIVRNFYFILDGSGSMTDSTDEGCGGDQRFPNKMAGAVWALERFMTTVPNDVKIGLYVFDSIGQREVVPLGLDNRDAFMDAVKQVRPDGNTPLADAICYGTEQLVTEYKRQLGYGEFRLVVITDGLAEKIPEAAIFAAQHGIPIYTIGLCVGEKHPLRRFSVSYKAADNFADLASGLSETLAELPNFDAAEFNQAP